MKKWTFLLFCLSFQGFLRAQDAPAQSIPVMLDRVRSVRDDTARLGLLLNIADAYVLKPGEEKTDLDSAFLLIGQVRTSNDRQSRDPRIAGLCELIAEKAWRERGNDSLAKIAAFRALDTFRHQRDSLDLAYAYCAAAGFYDYNVSSEDSIRVGYYRHAIPIFDRLGKTEPQARFRELLGECLLNLDGFGEALPVLLECLTIYRSMGHTDLRDVYSVLGTCYSELGDMQQGMDYQLKALRLEEARPTPEPSMITAYNRLGMTYNNLEQYANALEICKKALALATRLKRKDDAWLMALDVAIELNRVGRPQEALDMMQQTLAHYKSDREMRLQELKALIQICIKLGKPDLLIKYGEELAALYQQFPYYPDYRVGILIQLSQYTLHVHQYDRARNYDLDAIAFSRKIGSLSNLVFSYRTLYLIDSARGDQASALKDFRQYVATRDSANDVTHARQVAGLKVEYDVEKKEDSIRSLTKSQLLSQTALRQTGIARNATVAAAILLLVLLVLAINRYRLKQRSNRLLQLQKAEIDAQNAQLHKLVDEKEELLVIKDWLMKELNHRVGNNLHFMMSVQNMQAHNLNSTEALNAIMQSNNRLYAMSLIHRKLYQPDSEGSINMAQYIGDLVLHLSQALSPDNHIRLETDVAPVELDVAQAVPVGLILNEAITNAFKYAFGDTRPEANGAARPHICITLRTIGDAELEVVIKDNGKGHTPAVQPGRPPSLGFVLMEMLTKQLRGTLNIRNEEGLRIRVRFPAQFQTIPEKQLSVK